MSLTSTVDENNAPPLNLTLNFMWLPDTHYTFVNSLRTEYYPTELLFNPAHISLFARLTVPHELSGRLEKDIAQIAAEQNQFDFKINEPALWRKCVVLPVSSKRACLVRSNLNERWATLNVVDSQERSSRSYRPHITIHNRVSTQAARSAFGRAKRAFKTHKGPLRGRAVGIELYEYLDGQPWRLVASFPFS